MERMLYVIHAEDGSQSLMELSKALNDFKQEKRIKDYKVLPSESVSKESFKTLSASDMVLILLTQGIVNDKAEIEAPLLKLKERNPSHRVVEVLIDNVTFETEFIAFPRNLQPVTSASDKSKAWADIHDGLRELLPVQEEPVEPNPGRPKWKKYLPYLIGIVLLGIVAYYAVSAFGNEPKAQFSLIVQDPINDVVPDASECYVPCKIIGINESKNAEVTKWHIGDTVINGSSKPVHVFLSPKTYDIALSASSGNKSDRAVKSLRVMGLPFANFEIENNGCTAPCEIQFESTSANAAQYEWNFRQGTSPSNSNKVNPGSRRYPNPGRFPVQLTITDEGGLTADTLQYVTVVRDNTPFADFSVKKTSKTIRAPHTYQFSSTSKNASQYLWEIFEGNNRIDTKTARSFARTFPVGKYTVKLMVTGPGGTANTFRNLSVSNLVLGTGILSQAHTIDRSRFNSSTYNMIMVTKDSLIRN